MKKKTRPLTRHRRNYSYSWHIYDYKEYALDREINLCRERGKIPGDIIGVDKHGRVWIKTLKRGKYKFPDCWGPWQLA